jgi:hypothetical protein
VKPGTRDSGLGNRDSGGVGHGGAFAGSLGCGPLGWLDGGSSS